MAIKISDVKIRNYCLIIFTVVTSSPTNLLIYTYMPTYMYMHMKVIMAKTDNLVFRNCIDLLLLYY